MCLERHLEVPRELWQEAKLVRESWDILTSLQCSTGVVTTRDGWAQIRPYSSPLPPLVWVGTRLAFLELLSAFGFTSKWVGGVF